MGPANANRLGYPYSYNILLAKRHGQRLRLKVKFGRKVRVMSILFKSIIKILSLSGRDNIRCFFSYIAILLRLA